MAICREVVSLLYWAMLAACTVGPGTVVTCARAGAEYQLHFVWALLFASFLAFTLQEGSARLTIVSGKTLGQCLQEKYGQVLPKLGLSGPVPRFCGALALAVYFGNLLYECNNFAGGIDALFSFPGVKQIPSELLRIGGCFAYAFAVLGILYLDKADAVGVGLGITMMGMVVLFLVVAVTVGCSWRALLLGSLPSLPHRSLLHDAAAPCDTALSLVGTTAIGMNVFLSGAMARQKTLVECRRGIAFSCLSALVVSVLILIVAASVFKAEGRATGRFSMEFNIVDLAKSINGYFGAAGTTLFALGFVSAALSSMLTVVIGAALAFEGLLLQPLRDAEGKLVEPRLSQRSYWWIAFSNVSVAVFTILVNLPRPTIILVAQLFNGILLPFYCVSLLLCLTDKKFMGDAPQSIFANVCLYTSVTVAFILAWRVVVQKSALLLFLATGARFLDTAASVLLVATCLAVLSMLAVGRYAHITGRTARCYDSSDEGSISSPSIGHSSADPVDRAREGGRTFGCGCRWSQIGLRTQRCHTGPTGAGPRRPFHVDGS
ncbi:mntH [Symbiodinium microadriaticum]|nr:mntH [Symbiodinium microadriaticum]